MMRLNSKPALAQKFTDLAFAMHSHCHLKLDKNSITTKLNETAEQNQPTTIACAQLANTETEQNFANNRDAPEKYLQKTEASIKNAATKVNK